MIVSGLIALLVSSTMTAILVLVIANLVPRSPLYTKEVSIKILRAARVAVALVASWFIATTSFVRSSLYLADGYSPNFYTDLGPFGIILYNPIVQTVLSDPWVLGTLQIVTVLTLLLVATGYRLRIFFPVSILLYAFTLGTMLKASLGGHLGLQPLYLLLVLWGIHETVSYYKRQQKDDPAYTQAVYVLLVAITVPYLYAVIHKLKILGLDWFSAANIRGYLHTNEYIGFEYWQWPLTLWSTTWPDIFFFIGGAGVVLVQLVYPIVLVSNRARLALPLLIIAMHVAIYTFMGFLFYDLIVIQGVVLYAHYLGRSTKVTRRGQTLPLAYQVIVAVMIFIPTYQTVINDTWFPFTNWGVYFEPSYRIAENAFTYTSVQLVHQNGREETVSIPALQKLAGIYTYPRLRCYWQQRTWQHLTDCQLYFDRVVTDLNSREYNSDPIAEAHLQFHSWPLQELQAGEPAWSTNQTLRLYPR